MTENTATNDTSSKVGLSEYLPLSSLGFTMKSDRECAAEIVIALINSRQVSAAEVPGAFLSIVQAIREADVMPMPASETAAEPKEIEKPTPAQIKKSITSDGLISFIDGKTYKTLRRHLGTHGLEPHGYRQRYGLPRDYPMVAPSYSKARSELAKAIGLGVPAKGRKAAAG